MADQEPTSASKTETDEHALEGSSPMKDETNLNESTEETSLLEEQVEPVPESNEGLEETSSQEETTVEGMVVEPSEQQDEAGVQEEQSLPEDSVPLVSEEPIQEENEQQSISQEQPPEQLTADQSTFIEEQSEQDAVQEEVLGDQVQEQEVIGEQAQEQEFIEEQAEEQEAIEEQAEDQEVIEQEVEEQELMREQAQEEEVVDEQVEEQEFVGEQVEEQEVIGDHVQHDQEELIAELGQVLDKQEQTERPEQDVIANLLPLDVRQSQAAFDFQHTFSPEVTTNTTATVKVMVVPDGQVITKAFTIGLDMGMLKEYFASQFKIPQTVLQIMFEGKIVQDTSTLMDLGVRPQGTIQLEMLSTDQDNYPIKAMKPQHEYNMPDVITVKVQTDATNYQDVVVEIERLAFHKPYLGGYKHKLTGAEFHHAGTQTVPKKRPEKGIEVFCRDTQTVVTKNKHQQSRNTTSTQMTKIGCYVANLTDKLIEPKVYLTADEYHARRLRAVIVIQKYYRRLSAKRKVDELRSAKLLRMEWECQEEIRKMKEREERLKREHDRRMNPKTREDFEILYHTLEMWRLEEVERINNTLTGAERKAALCALLEQETQLIASIERYKLDANVENHKEAIQSFLDKCSQPKKWKGFDGRTMNMHTQYTIRARELRDIYNSIILKNLTMDERLDALLTLKQTVKEHDCKLTQEIVELIDREADLLMRGVQERNLEGLRKRISTLFLQYIKTPMFNPEVARLLKVPQDPAVLSKNIYFCPSCKSYLPSTEFPLSINARTVGRCRQCSKLDNQARQREDFSKYKLLLKQLKTSETSYEDEAKVAFLLQEQDIQYLVENIWASQSVLSSWDDLFDLVMARWNKYLEWTPWNCVLLTKDEAAAHLKLSNAEQAYGVAFIRKVKHKHTLAKNYFAQIPAMEPFLHQDLTQRKSERKDFLIAKSIPAASHA
ncbi:IQ motif and ubiquitin-like domain-containing protein [Ambystoma mexicanum]|uniref:IQ motif and ubiquitin-like domain-containing protein n=1 Tax=Ambystoma mexicanum TaxID=8296 RepID=UPI0037E8E167